LPVFARSLLYLAQGWCWWVSRTRRAVALVVLVACAGGVRAVLAGRSYSSAVAVVLACVLAAFAPMLVVLALA